MKNKSYIVYALIISILLSGIMIIGYNITTSTSNGISINRLFQMFGGDFINGGYIQLLCYFAFFWGLFEIIENRKYVAYQCTGLKKSLIQEEGNNFFVFYEDHITELNKNIVKVEEDISKNSPYPLIITGLIKKACVKYINTKQLSEVMDIIASQVRINEANTDSRHAMIRYLTWVIPSVGFIGTVLGIGQSLSAASIEPMDRTLVTNMLSVAFDTTLVALLLSVILVYFYHILQREEDDFNSETENYMINNLVNRIKPD